MTAGNPSEHIIVGGPRPPTLLRAIPRRLIIRTVLSLS